MKRFLLLMLVVVGLQSCTNDTKALNGEWTLVELKGAALGDKAPTLTIDLANMKANGSDGCNTFMGTIEKASESELVFGSLASSLMLCEDMATADVFNTAMKEVKNYQIKNEQLLLSNAQGEVLLTFSKNK